MDIYTDGRVTVKAVYSLINGDNAEGHVYFIRSGCYTLDLVFDKKNVRGEEDLDGVTDEALLSVLIHRAQRFKPLGSDRKRVLALLQKSLALLQRSQCREKFPNPYLQYDCALLRPDNYRAAGFMPIIADNDSQDVDSL